MALYKCESVLRGNSMGLYKHRFRQSYIFGKKNRNYRIFQWFFIYTILLGRFSMELTNLIPESLLIVVVATNIMGKFLKQTTVVEDRFIPIALLAFAIVFSIAFEGFTALSIVHGIIVWGIAVGLHQTVHQLNKK